MKLYFFTLASTLAVAIFLIVIGASMVDNVTRSRHLADITAYCASVGEPTIPLTNEREIQACTRGMK